MGGRNKLQSMKTTEETLALEPLVDKFTAFGWNVIEINGHDHFAIESSINSHPSENPLIIIANTTKGKGVTYMENKIAWHYKTPMNELFDQAINELTGT